MRSFFSPLFPPHFTPVVKGGGGQGPQGPARTATLPTTPTPSTVGTRTFHFGAVKRIPLRVWKCRPTGVWLYQPSSVSPHHHTRVGCPALPPVSRGRVVWCGVGVLPDCPRTSNTLLWAGRMGAVRGCSRPLCLSVPLGLSACRCLSVFFFFSPWLPMSCARAFSLPLSLLARSLSLSLSHLSLSLSLSLLCPSLPCALPLLSLSPSLLSLSSLCFFSVSSLSPPSFPRRRRALGTRRPNRPNGLTPSLPSRCTGSRGSTTDCVVSRPGRYPIVNLRESKLMLSHQRGVEPCG